ncbi:MAG: oxidoreductase [Acidobacteria bacterium]|nr:MAG: oxidoreductase [Acidobacteriota bacterium]
MRQLAQNYKDGTLSLLDAPVPRAARGGIVVRNAFSLISSGTETMKVREGGMSLIGKAKARPEQVQQVMQSVRQLGLRATYQKVMSRLDKLTPLGYSSSGYVCEVGEGIAGVEVGDKVACAGAEYANHAEYIFVPRNLFVRVPDAVRLEDAAFATVGAIAVQGVRQSDARLGETVAIIGLGLLGQLLNQLLVSAGCLVVGTDLSEERCRLACESGAAGAAANQAAFLAAIDKVSRGRGADCVLLAAGGLPAASFALAANIARDRGRVVNIGMNRLEMPWKAYYEKELEIRYSRSYGPGRYDRRYEEQGQDYPIGYVRWTENRNMEAFLDLLATGRINVRSLITGTYAFSEAENVYREMVETPGRHLAVLFQYPESAAGRAEKTLTVNTNGNGIQPASGLKLGCIGAGNYARSMLLPVLQKEPGLSLGTVVTRTPLSALDSARRFGFAKAGTDPEEVLNDPSTTAVLIATRHDSHAAYVIQALNAGKHVFVEKPLAIRREEISQVAKSLHKSGKGLQVGFNRRFAPMIVALRQQFGGTNDPIIVNYRVHAGKPAGSSWFFEQDQGGRFIGEAGHFIDVMTYLANSLPERVFARKTRQAGDSDEIAAVITFENGSIGTLTFVCGGDLRTPKEHIEVFGSGITGVVNNFQTGTVLRNGKTLALKGKNDKGQAGELAAFMRMLRQGGAPPVPYDQVFAVTEATIAIVESADHGSEITLEHEVFGLEQSPAVVQEPA